MFSPSNSPIPLDVPSSSSSSSSLRSLSILFVLLSIITLILEIVSFTQNWWTDLTPFAANVGTDYVNVSPTCSVNYMGYSQTILSGADCSSYNAIKAFLLLAHFAGVFCTILILVCIFAPSCRLRLPLRGLAQCVAITMIVSFICNLIAMFVFVGNEMRKQNECKKYFYPDYCQFPIHAGFILIIVVVGFQAVLCALLLPTVRSLMRFNQNQLNMTQQQPPQQQHQPYQQPQYQPQAHFQSYQPAYQQSQYPPQYQPPQPFVSPAPASAPAPAPSPLPSADAGVFVPIPGSNAYVYYPPGQSPAGAQQHVQAIQAQMQNNVPTTTM